MKKNLLIVILLLSFLVPGLLSLMTRTGDLFEFFPARGDFSLPSGAGGERIARRVLLITADGLGTDARSYMPELRRLGLGGAHYTLTTEVITMSRVGYAALSTGAKPEVNGVSSNEARDQVAVDNLFRVARRSGIAAAFVGYSWWLDLFDRDIARAAVDSGLKREDLRDDPPLPEGYRRRVLHAGRFVDLEPGASWRAYFRDRELYDSFGDDPATPIEEDRLRVREAARLLDAGADLVFLHLHSPDDEGHRTGGSNTNAYRLAVMRVDANVRRALSALDLDRDTLIVTSDHGFSNTIVDAGHGGPEATASRIPLVMAGAGIRPGAFGHARQIDVAPTIAVLLGLPFPTHVQGRPLWDALRIEPAVRQAARERYRQTRGRFIKAYANELGIAPRIGSGDSAGEALEASFAAAKLRLRAADFFKHFLPALALWLTTFFFMSRALPGAAATGWIGVVVWLAYESFFYMGYVWFYGEYSFSSFAVANENLAFMAGLSFGLLAAALIFASFSPLKHEASPGALMGFLFLAIFAKALFVFGFLGVSGPTFHPGSFWIFAGLSFYMQLLTAALALIGVAALQLARPR